MSFLEYAINTILSQRGIYPAEDFEKVQQYGSTILLSKNSKIEEFLQKVLNQIEIFLNHNELEKVSMVIVNARTKENLECWEFNINVSGDVSGANKENFYNTKDFKSIQLEMDSVMRQISASVCYLPILRIICSFDVLLHTKETSEQPEKWVETNFEDIGGHMQSVPFSAISTGVHSINMAVSYEWKK